jgi:hypothetical protein
MLAPAGSDERQGAYFMPEDEKSTLYAYEVEVKQRAACSTNNSCQRVR